MCKRSRLLVREGASCPIAYMYLAEWTFGESARRNNAGQQECTQ
jgi:hypothetical protein